MTIFFLIPLAFMLLGMLVSFQLKGRMSKYSQMPTRSGMSGREVAEQMLRDNGIMDVRVISTAGFLTDHYNPLAKTINLSEGVYNSRSVAAAAIAAHETGHAVQHAKAYFGIQLRSTLVPIAKVGGYISSFLMMGGLYFLRHSPTLLFIGVLGYAATTLFAFVTLPVEFDASKRGLQWLESRHITYGEEHVAAKDGLRWAALTYVVGALGALAQLLWLVMLFNRSR